MVNLWWKEVSQWIKRAWSWESGKSIACSTVPCVIIFMILVAFWMYLLPRLFLSPFLQQENVMKGTLSNKDRTRNRRKEVGKGSLCYQKLRNWRRTKRRTSVDIDGLIKPTDNLAEKAELTGNISLVMQSNSLRRTSKGKAKQLKTLGNKLEEKLQALKNF